MSKRVEIKLSTEDRKALGELTHKGKSSARKLKRAHILLLVDEGRSEQEIGQILETV